MGLSTPTGGGIVARTLLAALKAALSGNSTEISESQLAQIARVNILGKGNTVTVLGPNTVVPQPELDTVIARCFEVALRQPGLSIIYAVNDRGERIIRIDNIGSYKIPNESDLVVHSAPTRAKELELAEPPEVHEADIVSAGSPAEPNKGTSNEYAEYARYLMELPEATADQVDVEADS